MYKNILVAVDGSPTSNLALLEVAKLATADASVRVITVVENPAWGIPLDAGVMYDVEFMHTSLVKAAKDILERAKTLLQHKGINAKTHLIDLNEFVGSNIPKAIMKEADDAQADVVVIGTHGRRGFNRLLMGSVAEHVIRAATVPVLLVRAPGTADADDEAVAGSRNDNDTSI